MLRSIELKTGHNHDGPAWLAPSSNSASGWTRSLPEAPTVVREVSE
jgi:hypothetical protein